MFKIVITKERNQEMVSAVPEKWEDKNILFWPPVMRKSLLETLKSNPFSKPESNWKKLPCRVKLDHIPTFEKAIELEDFYSNAITTDDDEAGLKIKKDFSKKCASDVNYNNYFLENKDENLNSISTPIIISNIPIEAPIINNTLVTTNIENPDDNFYEQDLIQEEFENLKKENNYIRDEIIKLNIKIDKLLDTQNTVLKALEDLTLNNNSNFQNNNSAIDCVGITFPICTVEEIMKFETFLQDCINFQKMIKTLSRVCGTSGISKINKSGLILIRYMFNDEVLNKYTWRGVAGTNKLPFFQLSEIRKLIFNVLKLCDNTCSMVAVDSFLQNSAIKHSGQRIKRKNWPIDDNEVIQKETDIIGETEKNFEI